MYVVRTQQIAAFLIKCSLKRPCDCSSFQAACGMFYWQRAPYPACTSLLSLGNHLPTWGFTVLSGLMQKGQGKGHVRCTCDLSPSVGHCLKESPVCPGLPGSVLGMDSALTQAGWFPQPDNGPWLPLSPQLRGSLCAHVLSRGRTSPHSVWLLNLLLLTTRLVLMSPLLIKPPRSWIFYFTSLALRFFTCQMGIRTW